MTGPETALRQILEQSTRAGARRRAVLLHTDRLPPSLARPHHLRLAHEAIVSLAATDHAQSFDLPRGRTAIVWRSNADRELAQARIALQHLLAGQPDGTAPVLGELLTLYDLPEQAAWLLDEITQQAEPASPGVALLALDATQLACLEARLAQADLSRFARWRPVARLDGGSTRLAWEERYFALAEIAAELCPERDIKADQWLLRRLTRTLDRRMLAMLASPRELRGCGTFAMHLNVETILSAGFVTFDENLPLSLRGEVILYLDVADILSDPDGFAFARRFVRARGHRLGLADATMPLLGLLDLQEAGMDFVQVACVADLVAAQAGARSRLPAGTELVVGGLDTADLVVWAARQGVVFGRGRALSP